MKKAIFIGKENIEYKQNDAITNRS